jgi:predicted amidophosphoribosyltransferase
MRSAIQGGCFGFCTVGICPHCNSYVPSISLKVCNACSKKLKICTTCGKTATPPSEWDKNGLLTKYAELEKTKYAATALEFEEMLDKEITRFKLE